MMNEEEARDALVGLGYSEYVANAFIHERQTENRKRRVAEILDALGI